MGQIVQALRCQRVPTNLWFQSHSVFCNLLISKQTGYCEVVTDSSSWSFGYYWIVCQKMGIWFSSQFILCSGHCWNLCTCGSNITELNWHGWYAVGNATELWVELTLLMDMVPLLLLTKKLKDKNSIFLTRYCWLEEINFYGSQLTLLILICFMSNLISGASQDF